MFRVYYIKEGTAWPAVEVVSNETGNISSFLETFRFAVPFRVAPGVVVPQSDGLQVSQGKWCRQQKQIHRTSFKHTLLWIWQVMWFTVSLITKQSYCHLFSRLMSKFSSKTQGNLTQQSASVTVWQLSACSFLPAWSPAIHTLSANSTHLFTKLLLVTSLPCIYTPASQILIARLFFTSLKTLQHFFTGLITCSQPASSDPR